MEEEKQSTRSDATAAEIKLQHKQIKYHATSTSITKGSVVASQDDAAVLLTWQASQVPLYILQLIL